MFNLREILGIMIWWTEGTKAYKDKRWKNVWICNVDVTNTNPEIIQVFLEFLRKDIKIDESRLKLQLQIHEGDDKEKLEKYWGELTKIPKNRFNKTIVRPAGNKIGKSMGTCKVRYSDQAIYYKINTMRENLLKYYNEQKLV